MSEAQDIARFRSAVAATNVAMAKWRQVAYGTRALTNPKLRARAQIVCVALSAALRKVDDDAGT